MAVGLNDLIAVSEAWIKDDPRWVKFQQGCGRGWNLRFAVMDKDERICWESRTIWLAMFRWPDPKFRAVHAIGHIKQHWGAERFTEEQCKWADEFASYWLAMTADGSVPEAWAA